MLDRALAAITDFGTRLLVLSFGADTYVEDPISHFALQRPDFAAMARRKCPTGGGRFGYGLVCPLTVLAHRFAA